MTFALAVRTCFAKYFTFSGRATRPEYWWFFLFILLGNLLTGLADLALFGSGTEVPADASETTDASGPIATVFSLATFIPTLSAGWRRMHDTGRSGLYLLYPLIAMTGLAAFVSAFVGFENLIDGNVEALMAGGLGIVLVIALIVVAVSPFIVLFWLTRPSQQGENQYGPNPHEVSP